MEKKQIVFKSQIATYSNFNELNGLLVELKEASPEHLQQANLNF